MHRIMAHMLIGLLTLAGGAAADGDALLGLWLTEDDQAKVEIIYCEEDEAYVGTIVWLDEPEYAEDEPYPGEPKRDLNNPDPDKRDEPIIGLQVLEGFTYDGRNRWSGGTIYDPENGRTYSCRITRDNDELHVRGFIGVALFGRTTVWTRYVPEESEENEQPDES